MTKQNSGDLVSNLFKALTEARENLITAVEGGTKPKNYQDTLAQIDNALGDVEIAKLESE